MSRRTGRYVKQEAGVARRCVQVLLILWVINYMTEKKYPRYNFLYVFFSVASTIHIATKNKAYVFHLLILDTLTFCRFAIYDFQIISYVVVFLSTQIHYTLHT